MTAPAATATASGDTLAEEIKLRKAAEDEVKSLKAEIARLNEVEEKRLAELAGQRRAAEAGEKKKSAETDAEKARVAAALKEIDDLKGRCLGRDAIACERALALAREASVTGSIDTAKVSELQQLHTLAVAPFGVQALSFLGGVPRSTWAASSIAAFLAMSLLLVMSRRRQPIVLHEDVMSMPSLDETPLPSLDPFALTPQESHAATPHSVEAVLSIPSHSPARSAPPPIPAFASMPALFPAKEA
jgi:hypothetical protein